MASLDFIHWLQGFATPWLTTGFRFITDLGGESFYIVGLALLYWCFDRQVAYKLGTVFLFSTWANASLKDWIGTERPPVSIHLTEQYGPAFPSGHAQGSTVFWGYLALAYGRRWLTWLAVAVIALVSLSRLYLGVHWPVDVAGGILIGIALLALVRLGSRRSAKTWEAFPWLLQMTLVTLAPLALLVFHMSKDAAVAVGALSGLSLGHFLNERYVRSGTAAALPVQLLKVLGGLALLLVLRVGLKTVLPASDFGDLLRYWVIGFGASYVWPWILSRFSRPVRPSVSGTIRG
ncbi:MAG: phosphatase PAP2 family protein [Symbiobacteriia bacterium]